MNIFVLLLFLLFPFWIYALLLYSFRSGRFRRFSAGKQSQILFVLCVVFPPIVPFIKIVTIRTLLSATVPEEAAQLIERHADIKYFYASDLAISIYFVLILMGIGVSWLLYRRTLKLD